MAVINTELPADDQPTAGSHRRRWLIVVTIVVAVFTAVTVVLFTIPHNKTPRRADAIVVLGGPGNRMDRAAELAREGVAPLLVVSDGIPDCPPKRVRPAPTVPIVCFRPDPFTTQGEARAVAAMARRHGWHHLVVVTSTDQRTRAMLRFGRCTDVTIDYVTTPLAAGSWPYYIAYQWAALAKALTLQRSC